MGDSSRYFKKDIAAEAHELDDLEWIIYDPQKSLETLSDFLEEWIPSRAYREDGIAWICVRGYNVAEKEISICNLTNLLKEWNSLKESGRQIDLQKITELAKTYALTSGKWILHVDTGVKANYFWKLIARGIVEGKLPSNCAKISSVLPDEENHVVCIYNKNFTDNKEVCLLEKGIREIGLKCCLRYKPDVYTYIDIYRGNKWNLRPTIYKSVYDILTKQSKITTNETYPQTLQY